ncbi:MAG: hypothetical protein J7639_18240, partial [Paenibacillaceae bacterium]|nr:hypothetical protein [Paenibacillaceae bacterium]
MQGTQVPLDYSIHVDTIYSQIDDLYYWVHPRAGTIPGDPATVVLAMQKYYRIGDDYFGTVYEMRTHDVGQTWVGPIEHDGTLSRRRYGEGMDMVICDFCPQWHAATGKLIGMGHTAVYADNSDVPLLRAKNIPVYNAYSVYDEATHTWAPFKLLEVPDKTFYAAGGAGMQRLELPNGDLLVPCYYRVGEASWERTMWACTVWRCRFDGETMTYVEHGTELFDDTWSGLAEASLTRFKGKYYMTLRGQKGEVGYVTSGDDGLHYDQPQVWKWDDGSDLRSYNTQQHWVTHSEGLFLVYTRDTGTNSHVCRHRSPLFIAQVDPDRLVLLRDSERVLLEDRGADLGNFST